MTSLKATLMTIVISLVGGSVHAAQVIKYTGVQLDNGMKPFEIVIRWDAPHDSFTIASDGLTFGFDDTFMPLEFEPIGDRYVEFNLRSSQIGLDGNKGLTYYAGRLTPNNALGSNLDFYGRYVIPPIRGDLYIEEAQRLEEPDLPAGYLDLSGLRPGKGGIPEPASWALMILGFGAVGVVARRRQYRVAELHH